MLEHKLRPMTEFDLEQVLEWRNHPKVRSFMYSTHEIRIDEHRAWYAEARNNPAISLFIYEHSEKPLGFVNITRERFYKVAEWGFYLAPDAPKGCGYELGKLALSHAFTQLELHKLCGQVLGFNKRSIAFHTRLGFKEEGRLREQYFDGCRFHDVVCFGLLNDEWQSQLRSE